MAVGRGDLTVFTTKARIIIFAVVIVLGVLWLNSIISAPDKTLKIGTVRWVEYSAGGLGSHDITTLYLEDNTILVFDRIITGFELGETYVLVYQNKNLVSFEVYHGLSVGVD